MKKRVLLLHCIISLLLGGIIYFVFSPEVHFINAVDKVTGLRTHIDFFPEMTPVTKVIRYWGPDMLWSYALLFSLHLVTDNSAASTEKLFCIAVLFTLATEVVQFIPGSSGTFDVWDIIAEWTSLLIAEVIIKYYTMRRRKNEST